MRNSLRAGVFLLAAIAMSIAGCGNPTAGKPAAEVSEALPTESSAAAGQLESGGDEAAHGVVYTCTANSGIDFEGYKVTGPHVGGFGKFEGTVTVLDGDIEQAQIRVEIDMASTYSDNPDLTDTLLGKDFFEVETYPRASFVSTSIESFPDGTYGVSGNLELHGITKGITFPASIDLEGGTLRAEAEFTIDRFDWDITYEGVADDLIRRDVLIVFEIEAAAEED